MPLDRTALKTSIKALFAEAMSQEVRDKDDPADYIAEQWANVIDAYIKTALVTINNASVTTYPVPTPGTGTIS